ncbi:hypothetical protein HWV62_41721, partial [Athelia sp. TMB]
VMEGYSTGTSSGPTATGSPTTQPMASYGAPIFQSAKDTIREVYSMNTGTDAPRLSQNKRGRAKSEEPETEMDNQSEQPASAEGMPHSGPSFSGPELRPIRPLKRTASGRQFSQTQSMPAGSLRFSNDSQSISGSTGLEAQSIEEEDWSEAPSFASASKPTMDI